MTVSCRRWGVAIRAASATPGTRFFNRPAVLLDAAGWRREYSVEGYLERKLHRQWRNRGS